MTKVRVTRSVQNEVREQPGITEALRDKFHPARSTRKDGSLTVDLDFKDAREVFSIMDLMRINAQDNVGDDPAYLSQIRSAQAMMTKLMDAFGYDVTKL